MDSITLLELLEEEFFDGKGFARRKVDLCRCKQLIDELKNSLPECIKDAQQIIDNKQTILKNADTVAKNTISAAEQKVQHLVSESEIEILAQQEAKKIVSKATIQRDVLIDKTKSHLENMFDQTEQMLISMLNMIRKNKQELRAVVFK